MEVNKVWSDTVTLVLKIDNPYFEKEVNYICSD